ncbi:MAG: cob(I)yrinic acid a,c-diamide adenosyltransferase [Gemmatimonadales bacterium]|nr:cob(I)yrinic acid a,c-diamide adenosyltransferase [Gemmatimonadales bacterium]
MSTDSLNRFAPENGEPFNGRVQVYTGTGKGKTTAAIGLAVRAAGHGYRSFIGQFMKGIPYGEHTALKAIPEITIEQFGDEACLRKEEITELHRQQARSGLARCREIMHNNTYDLIVLDEINVTIWFGLVSEQDVLAFVEEKPKNVELILTGRHAPQTIVSRADLVTEMKSVKHYFDGDLLARDGIER